MPICQWGFFDARLLLAMLILKSPTILILFYQNTLLLATASCDESLDWLLCALPTHLKIAI